MRGYVPIPGTETISIVPGGDDVGVLVKLRSVLPPPIACPDCGADRNRNGTRRMIFQDVPVQGHPVMIEWRRQKLICSRCSRSSHEAHPAFDGRHAVTRRFIDWVSDQGRMTTFSTLARQSSVNEKVIREIFSDATRYDGRSAFGDVLGIEMIKVTSGRPYPALIDVRHRTVVDVFPSISALILAISDRWTRGGVEEVTTVVHDFEVIDETRPLFSTDCEHLISRSSLRRNAVSSMETAADPLFRSLRAARRSTVADLAVFRKRQLDLGQAAENRLSEWGSVCPALRSLYDLKERFLDMWGTATNPEEGKWEIWMADARSLGSGLDDLIGRIESLRTAIEAYVYRLSEVDYVSFVEDVEGVSSVGTHSFSASRALLLEHHGGFHSAGDHETCDQTVVASPGSAP